MGGGLQHYSLVTQRPRTSLLMAVKTRKRSKGGFSQLPVCGVTKSRDTAVRTSGLWRSQETLTPRAGAFPQSHNCFLSLRSGFHEEGGSLICKSQINTVSFSFNKKDSFVYLICPMPSVQWCQNGWTIVSLLLSSKSRPHLISKLWSASFNPNLIIACGKVEIFTLA